MTAPPKSLLDRALGYLLGFSALAVVLVSVIVALPLSAFVAFLGMMSIIAILGVLGVDSDSISSTLSMLALVAIPVLTFGAVVWVYRRLPKQMKASLKDSDDRPSSRPSRSRDELWREVTELDARFGTPQPPGEP